MLLPYSFPFKDIMNKFRSLNIGNGNIGSKELYLIKDLEIVREESRPSTRYAILIDI